MSTLHLEGVLKETVTGVAGALSDGFLLRVELLERDICRIAIVPQDGLDADRTWSVALDGEVPWEGRDRLSCAGFSCPSRNTVENGWIGEKLRVFVEAEPLQISVEQRIGDRWIPIFRDRSQSAWQWFERAHRLKHFQAMNPGEAHYGLGDATGPLDRTGRRIRCLQSDALGYNAENSDPLYKHAPFVIVSGEHGAGGLFYDTLAETVFDLGAEHSNYFERFRHVEMTEKGCVLYVLAGPEVRDVVPRLHALIGRAAMPPRWSLGFAFTSMHHADAPNAQEVITDFARESQRRGLPLSAIHLGSGYTAGEDGLRYVFNWNTGRFPDRGQFFETLKGMGIRTCANVKPVLLTGHAQFEAANKSGWFIKRAAGSPAIEAFWGGKGAQIDFTNPDAISWWKEGIQTQVLGAGFDAVWNDNNEAELWDETARLDGFGGTLPAIDMRPVHALLMTRASHEAIRDHKPDERPYTISRAGPIGIARYGETWSGDNRTSWHTLKWNLRQGLSMSLSGFPLVGHDIGGFDGPPPDAELLVRWFQMMALHPRCVMNSWKPEHGNVPNLPWMHEDAWPAIRAALGLRARLMPLLYALCYDCHKSGQPIIAPTFYHFEDVRCRAEADTFMLGPDLLVAPVVTQGARDVSVYLPDVQEGWVSFDALDTGSKHQPMPGGRLVNVDAPLDRLPLFVRGGSVLPLATNLGDCPHDALEITLRVVPGIGYGENLRRFFLDNGYSPLNAGHPHSLLECRTCWETDAPPTLSVFERAGGIGEPLIRSDVPTDWMNIPHNRRVP